MASGKTYCAGQWTHRDERTQCLGIQFYHKVLCDPVSMSAAYHRDDCHRDDCHRDNQNGQKQLCLVSSGYYSSMPQAP